MAIEVEAINKIEKLVEDKQVLEIDGRKWSPGNLKPIIFNPKAPKLECITLSAITAFIDSNIDGINPADQYIHIEDVDQVSLVSKIFGDDRAREVLIMAKLDSNLKAFPFDRFLSQEEFIIKANSMIQRSEGDDFEYLMKFVSKLTSVASAEEADDGITQAATIRRGASGALTGTEQTKAIVKLAPFRTFRDIDQVQSEFLFRIKAGSNGMAEVALFEADGGAWRIKAIERIAEYFRARLPDQVVLA